MTWTNINERSEYCGPAFYIMRLAVDGQAVPISYPFGPCPQGIIDFGSTDDFERRRREFLNGFLHEQQHSAGIRLGRLYRLGRFREAFPQACVHYKLMPFDLDEAQLRESAMQKWFRLRYGTGPLLNVATVDPNGERIGWNRVSDLLSSEFSFLV